MCLFHPGNIAYKLEIMTTGGDTGLPYGAGGGGGGLAIPSMRSHDSWAFDPPSVQCIQKMKHINKGATIGIRGVGVFLK